MTIEASYTCDAESKLTYLAVGDEIVCMNCYERVVDQRDIAEEENVDLKSQVEYLSNKLEETQMALADALEKIDELERKKKDDTI